MRWRRISSVERNEIWKQWRRGSSIAEVARLLGKDHSNIWKLVHENGGFAPRARRRADGHLTTAEREEISLGLSRNVSLRAIAKSLRRSPSTISREVNRNGGRTCYRATEAEGRAQEQSRRPKRCKLAVLGASTRRCCQASRILVTRADRGLAPPAASLRSIHACLS